MNSIALLPPRLFGHSVVRQTAPPRVWLAAVPPAAPSRIQFVPVPPFRRPLLLPRPCSQHHPPHNGPRIVIASPPRNSVRF